MSESAPLSLVDLEHYDPQPLARGDSRHYLCPFCGDNYKRDNANRKLRVWPHGGWYCIRCEHRGLLEEYKTKASDDPLRPKHHKKPHAKPRPLPPPPSAAEVAETKAKQAKARDMWLASAPIDAPAATPGAAYLEGRGIPLAVAVRARVRYSPDWYGRAAVLFRMQGEGGRLVAAEGRWLKPPTPDDKARSAGPKRTGVFLALPGALLAEGVTVCEGAITALSIAVAGYPALALCGRKAPPWLVRRLALRTVLIAFDEGEEGVEEKVADLTRALTVLGANVYRLRCPAAVGDWNDYLRSYGLDAMDAALHTAMMTVAGAESH
jgi:hypothetical protein